MAVAVDPLVLKEGDLGPYVEIANGGMAKVHAMAGFLLPEAPGRQFVYKKYRAKTRPVPLYGLKTLVGLLDQMEPGRRTAFERSFNWPVRVVVDDGTGASGVVLPLLHDDYFVSLRLSSGRTSRKPTEGQFLLQDSAYCAKVGIPFADVPTRRALCRSLCYAMALLDKADVVYGDLSSRNFLYRLLPKPQVLLVDCDAVRPQGQAAALGKQPHSPDWEPPEALAARATRDSGSYNIQSKATDRYKLGLAILRMLTPGPGCSTRTDPRAARSALTPSLYQLLQQSLSADPKARPTAKTWYEELTRA